MGSLGPGLPVRFGCWPGNGPERAQGSGSRTQALWSPLVTGVPEDLELGDVSQVVKAGALVQARPAIEALREVG